MNLATDRLKTIFSYSDYDFGSLTDARGFSAIMIVCMHECIMYNYSKYLHLYIHVIGLDVSTFIVVGFVKIPK